MIKPLKACPLGNSRSDVPSGQARMRPDRSPPGDFDAVGGGSLAESDDAPPGALLAAKASLSASADSDAQSVTVRKRAQRFAETPLAAAGGKHPCKVPRSFAAVQRDCRPFVDGISTPT